MSQIRNYLMFVESSIISSAGRPPVEQTHHTPAGWLLEHGGSYPSQPLTNEEMAWLFALLDDEGSRYRIKECFYNSQKVLMFARSAGWTKGPHELKYAEGYCHSIIPVLHGWLLLNDKVVDLTMRFQQPFDKTVKRQSTVGRRRLKDRVLGEFPESREYFGTSFPTESVVSFVARTGTLGSILDDWESGYPVLHPSSPHYPLK